MSGFGKRRKVAQMAEKIWILDNNTGGIVVDKVG